MSAEPDDLDKAFVADYKFSQNSDSDFRFGFFITTKRLLNHLPISRILHADATYKLNWNGFPVLVTGTSDSDRQFHPFGLATTYGETAGDYEFVFATLKRLNLGPEVLVSDCADAIRNAFLNVFGEDKITAVCWAHVIRNIDQKLHLVTDTQMKTEIRRDIYVLQLCKSAQEFGVAKELFLKKWATDDIEQFVSYFRSQYLEKHTSWYEGIDLRAPSTNNCLEATNRWIKTLGTFRERHVLGRFVEVCTDIVQSWSRQRNPQSANNKHFIISPTYDLKLQTTAYNWIRQAKIRYRTIANRKLFFISPDGVPCLKDADVVSYLRQADRRDWRTWSSFQKHQSKLWLVTLGSETWETSTCTCPIFLKQYKCKHVYGIALHQKLVLVPDEAKSVPIGQKRKRGRPAQAKKALFVQ